jgi:hypothetical protein
VFALHSLLISLIIIATALLAWLVYEEVQRSQMLEAQANELLAKPFESSSTPLTESHSVSSSEPLLLGNDGTPIAASLGPELATNFPTLQVTPKADTIAETSAPEPTEHSAQPGACSSFDEASLLAAFDSALASFLANATATYGSQYENLHYHFSSKKGVLAENQGTVTASYAGTVQELSTGESVSATGTINASFTWDGCAWQTLDYSF